MARTRPSSGIVSSIVVVTLVVVATGAALALAPSSARAQCPPGRLFGSHAPYAAGPGPTRIVLADFNADGILDLAAASGSTTIGASGKGAVSVRLGRGTAGVGDGSFAPAVSYAAGVRLVDLVTEDFDEDGILDLAAADYDGAQIALLFGKGYAGAGDGTFASPLAFAFGTLPTCLATGDFNKDGITDLVFADESSPSQADVAVMLGLGSGGVGSGDFGPPQRFYAGTAMRDLLVADFDEDGISDLAVTTSQPMGVAVLRGAGSAGIGNGAFLPPVNVAQTVDPFAIVEGDFDEDGIVDLATANHATSVLLADSVHADSTGGPAPSTSDGGSVWVMRGRGTGGVGDGTFDPAVSYPASSHANGIAAADWNGDGVVDLAVANETADSVTVLLGQGIAGTGNGTFGQPTSYHAYGWPMKLAAADVNEDGAEDLIAAEFAGNDVRVWLGGCAPHTGVGPHIDAVRDVPGDQGGLVFVAWRRSPYDGDWGTLVRNYRVWRRTTPEDAWEELATLPAQRLEAYGYAAATARDSTSADNPETAFRVTALTADAEMMFESTVDSGYSVDNLPPPPPESFEATYAGSVALRWVTSDAPDRAFDRLYRGESPDFALTPERRVADVVGTSYVDLAGTAASVYKLVAVDRHGNESAAALATPSDVTPASYALAITGLGPNPVRGGRLAVAFTLPSDAIGRLDLVDARGRVVCSRAVSGRGPGSVALPGEAASLASGVYVVRLAHEGRVVRAKSVVLR
jgi:hypothetical protein